MASKRKPYVREMNAGWWKSNPFYRFYMLREGTSIFAVWISLLLLYFPINPAGYIKLLHNPIIIAINIVAFLAALLHTKTWFELAPKAVNINERQNSMMIKALWGVTVAASVIILLLAFTA